MLDEVIQKTRVCSIWTTRRLRPTRSLDSLYRNMKLSITSGHDLFLATSLTRMFFTAHKTLRRQVFPEYVLCQVACAPQSGLHYPGAPSVTASSFSAPPRPWLDPRADVVVENATPARLLAPTANTWHRCGASRNRRAERGRGHGRPLNSTRMT